MLFLSSLSLNPSSQNYMLILSASLVRIEDRPLGGSSLQEDRLLSKIVVILGSCSIRYKVLATNLPSKKIFRASKSNSFYLVLLLFMLLVIMLPIVYSMSINASKRCGPYSTIEEVEKSYEILSWTIKSINVSGYI